ncbi:MAG: hypothetical protein JJ863_28685 [Deltaproteobacteria bacterium]|nr:hypothetical protein [Deltaproteobacteria bacterium]
MERRRCVGGAGWGWVALWLGLVACGDGSGARPDAGIVDAAPTDQGSGDMADTGPRGLRDWVADGEPVLDVTTRPDWATLIVRADPDGRAAVVLESRRDDAFGHRRRIRAIPGGWTVEEADGEVFHDVVVHPSGAVSLAIEAPVDRGGYLLSRWDATGTPLAREQLAAEQLPASDWDVGLPTPPWRHRARPLGALEQGWVRLAADGEGLVVVHQSLIDGDRTDLVSGVTRLTWAEGGWSEVWTRLVDGAHHIEPPLWNYDDFRFIDVLVRPILALDPMDGTVVVGRTWTRNRCRAALRVFAEFDARRCFEEATADIESRVLPFFFTVYSSAGERLGSHVFVPQDGYYYGVHDMVARSGAIALAGVVAETDADGPRLYPSRPGASPDMVAFDGLLAIVERDGEVRVEHHVDRGRGDLFLAVRWFDEGIVAAGATDWDRWPGGMSVSRGADPWLAHLDPDGDLVTRAIARPWTSRHALAYDLALLADRLVVVGADDAPMTHSGDGGRLAAMTFGNLTLTLR